MTKATALTVSDRRWLEIDAAAKGMTPEAYAAKYGTVLSPSRAAERSRRGGDYAEVLQAAEVQFRGSLGHPSEKPLAD